MHHGLSVCGGLRLPLLTILWFLVAHRVGIAAGVVVVMSGGERRSTWDQQPLRKFSHSADAPLRALPGQTGLCGTVKSN